MKFAISTIAALAATPLLAAETYAFGPIAIKISSPLSATRLSAAGNSKGQPDNFSLSPDEYKAFSRFGEDMLKQAFPKITEKDLKTVSRFSNEIFKPVLRNYVPGYEVIDNDELFSVQVDVPGVKAEDLNINLEDDDKVLTLSGSRKKLRDGQSYVSDFSESFHIDPTVVDTGKLSADLQNGVLAVSAPKIVKIPEPPSDKKSIPITTGGRIATPSSPDPTTYFADSPNYDGSDEEGDDELKSSSRDIPLSI